MKEHLETDGTEHYRTLVSAGPTQELVQLDIGMRSSATVHGALSYWTQISS